MKKPLFLIPLILIVGSLFLGKGESLSEVSEEFSVFPQKLVRDEVTDRKGALQKHLNQNPELELGDEDLQKIGNESFREEDLRFGVNRLMMMAFHDKGGRFMELLPKNLKGQELSNLRDDEGGTLLHWSVMGNCRSCLTELLKRGIDVNAANKRGETALVFAAGSGDNEVVGELLEKGADPNIKFNKAGYTLLMDSSFEGLPEVARLLIKNHAALNDQDKTGMTALHYAAREGHHEMVEILIQAGANKFLLDQKGFKPEDYAKKFHGNSLTSLFY